MGEEETAGIPVPVADEESGAPPLATFDEEFGDAPLAEPTDDTDDGAEPPLLSPLHRAILVWGIVAVLLIVAFFSAIAAINREFYSASGFVTGYLSALARGDAPSALRYAGVTVPEEGSRALLRSAALAEISDIEVVGDVAFGDGTRLVTVGYKVAAADSAPRALESTFHVESQPSAFWLFENWRFADTPVGTLDVRVQNDPAFRANGMEVDIPPTALAGDTNAYLVFTPGLYRLDHDSVYLTATPVDAIVDQIGEHAQASVEVTAKPAFVERVQQELDDYLDACAEQTVLFPRDCPFGQLITNRISTEPAWSIAAYPPVEVNGTGTGWLVPRSRGAAHLTVDVRSIFDGSVETFDEDIPFTVSYSITFTPDGSLSITEVQ